MSPLYCIQTECSVRSPAVLAAVGEYVRRIMNLFGLETKKAVCMNYLIIYCTENGTCSSDHYFTFNLQGADQSEVENRFSTAMGSLLTFRHSVRQFAMNDPADSDDKLTKKERRKIRMQQMEPLLTACDTLREQLGEQGVTLLVGFCKKKTN